MPENEEQIDLGEWDLIKAAQMANGAHYGALAQNSPAQEQGRAKFSFSMVPPAGLEPTT